MMSVNLNAENAKKTPRSQRN